MQSYYFSLNLHNYKQQEPRNNALCKVTRDKTFVAR